MSKPKVAFYWCASCGGCEEAVVDLDEKILDVVAAIDIVLWPVALDFKKKDIEAMKDGEIAVSFINGAIRMSEQEEWVKLLRAKSGLVVAFGACAQLGGVPGLANYTTKAEIFANKYLRAVAIDNPQKTVPLTKSKVNGYELELPEFWDEVKALDDVIPVDYYLPGCPPPVDLIVKAVTAILKGELPPKGAVLAPDKSCCEGCPLNETKPEKMAVKAFKRLANSAPDPKTCFLAQGYVCMGPATRSGCGERCIRGNMPCRGCFGPPPGALDQGAKFLSSLGSMIDAGNDEEARAAAATIADPAGTFYRFSMPKSLLRRRRVKS
jgi:F420-non-reducing hydrogenase small subunit